MRIIPKWEMFEDDPSELFSGMYDELKISFEDYLTILTFIFLQYS